MSLSSFFLFIIGLVFLVAGAEALVRGASRLAAIIGISPLVVGLTVVAFGTSSPELAVSVMAGLGGKADISLGNVVGSNIFNVLFILGLSALIIPLAVSRQLIKFDVPVMIGVSLLVFLFGIDGRISRPEGIIFFTGIVSYTAFLIIKSRHRDNLAPHFPLPLGERGRVRGSKGGLQKWLINSTLILVGLALLILGSHWLIDGAVIIAKAVGVSELVLGLTIVAVGTSLPEVATSVVATIRGERDIAVGNVVGSNIFNILAVLGLSGIVASNGITVSPTALQFDIPVMIAVAISCLPIFFTYNMITRWEGMLLLGYYAAYTTYLILYSIHHEALPIFSTAMVAFIIPVTAITLITVTLRSMRKS